MADRRDYRITFADALTKLNWGIASWNKDEVPLTNEIHLLSARNAVAAAQVHVTAGHDFTLVVDRANWLNPLGFTPRLRLDVRFDGLDPERVEVFPVGYVDGDDRRVWMEYFDRAGYAEVPAERPQAAYIRIRVPAELEPGIYQGQVRAFTQYGFEDEQPAWQGTISLEVVGVTLPEVKDYQFHMNLWQHLTSIARFHHVALWSDEHFMLIDRYYASLAQLGQKVVSIVATEMPWSGQRCYRDRGYPSYLFEHAMIDVTRGTDGALRYDYTALDRVLALATKHHIDRQIDVFGLINIWLDEEYGFGAVAEDAPDAVRVRCYDEGSGAITYLRTAGDLRHFMRALHDHFAVLGVLDRVRVAADEPSDLEKFNRSLAFVHEAGPDFKFSAAVNHFEFLEDAPEGLIDFIPILPLACNEPELTVRLTAKLHERGGKMHWYVCCWPPIPNVFIHSPLPEAVLHGWLTHALALDGFLRWDFCLWPAAPWERISYRVPDWHAGDMSFVMPGKDGAPVETLRYEALRTAVQDYELIKMVERKLPEQQAKAVIDQALGCILRVESLSEFASVAEKRAGELYSVEPADYNNARKMILDALK
jgi:hypothetical protein